MTMIKINLLPDELKRQRIILPKDIFIFAGVLIVGMLVLWMAGVGEEYKDVAAEAGKLQNNSQAILTLRDEYSGYKKRLESLEERAVVVNYLMADRVHYSQKLNELSDLLAAEIWLNHLSLNSEALTIEGNVYSIEGKEEAIVGNFMNSIKQHDSFFKDFEDVELKIIKRKIQDMEHISFTLFCHLKQKADAGLKK